MFTYRSIAAATLLRHRLNESAILLSGLMQSAHINLRMGGVCSCGTCTRSSQTMPMALGRLKCETRNLPVPYVLS
jgi:hypothetical protein